MSKLIGDNSHGNENEVIISNAINEGLKKMPLNLKEFIKYICKNEGINYSEELKVSSTVESNNKLKQDIYIYIENKKFYISLKMGTGNSVHQEKCEDFIEYIKNAFKASEEICNLWRFFLWADGTLDGSGSLEKNEKGEIKCRFNAKEFKKIYPEKRKKLQKFLNENEKELINHFLFVGRYNSRVDYIYHGTADFGSWIKKENIIEYQINNKTQKKIEPCLSIGKMTVQAWNISKSGEIKTEKKRGVIQIKYSQMKKDFNNLMLLEKENIGTFEGDTQEFNLTKVLNKNKKHKMWKKLINTDSYDNLFLIKVDTKPKSKLSNKKVFPKSDAYVIKANISEKYLLQHEYVLAEKDIVNIEHEIVKNTGISIKIRESEKYTIQKFTKDSFIKAMKDIDSEKIEYILLGLLAYSNEKDIYRNEKIANDLNVNYNEFINDAKIKISNENRNKKFFDEIRKYYQNIVYQHIENNKKLKEAIFTGKYWFDDPYYAKYMYVHGELVENDINKDFIITTGSGRSKGKYSIEIKPKY